MRGAIFQFLCMMLFAISVAASPRQDATRRTLGLAKRDRDVGGGSLYCLSENNEHAPGDPNYFMTKEGAQDFATASCESWKTTGAQLHSFPSDPSDTNSTQVHMLSGFANPPTDKLDPQYGRIVVTAGYSASDRCNSTINFKDQDIHDKCLTALFTAINGCDTKKNNVTLWKQGGRFYHGCVTWTISKLAVNTLQS